MNGPSARENLSVEAVVGQVADEFLQRLQRGEQPDAEEYARRHPELAPVLRQVLAALQIMQAPATGPAATNAPAVPPEPATGCLGDFRLLREVGRGGMGVVYEAEQISLGRRVALKVLPFAGTLDPKQLQRFKNEAQAAANLQHQNIVPVYFVGCERGVHFYAMQFIEGQTLAAVIEELRQLSGKEETGLRRPPEQPSEVANALASGRLPQLEQPSPHAQPTTPYGPVPESPALETTPKAGLSTERSITNRAYFRTVAYLGVQAAEALEYAHEMGVVHRDVKPGNLLVDGRGHVWITDFGLAHCQSQAGLTMTGDLVGTLRYMSPEQALAKRMLIDHRTDIYSLGVSLYELSTLEPAFGGADRQELLRQIAFEEPRPLRRLNRAVPAELETIVLKAMAKEPGERYATAQELADDLERFLKDVPIRARRLTAVHRAAKWARRHRVVVRSAAVVLAVAVVALTAGTVLIWQAKEQTEAALVQAREQQRLAQENGAKAEANSRLAWQAFTDDLFAQALEEWGAGRPELAEARRKSLTKALHFYETFARENQGNPALQAETAKAYRRVGDIRKSFDEHPQAEEAYRQALKLQQSLIADFPAVPAYRQDLANSHNNLGRFLEDAGRFPEAERAYRRALDLYQKLVADSPTASARATLAITHLNLGNVLALTGRTQKAEVAFREAQAAQEQLVAEFPATPLYRQELASTHNSLAALLLARRQSRAAEPRLRSALELLQPLATETTDPSFRAKLAGTHHNLGIVLGATGRARQAEEAYRTAITLGEKLAADFPMVPDYRHNLAENRLYLARLLVAINRTREAVPMLAQALTALEDLAAAVPAVPKFRATLAAAHEDQGLLWETAGKTQDAEKAYRRALTLRQRVVDEMPQVLRYRSLQASTYHNLGILLQNTSRHDEAEEAYRQGLTLVEKLAADFSDVPDYRHRLAAIQNSLGVLFQETGRVKEAEAAYRRALTLVEKLAVEFPEDTGYRRLQANGHFNLGNLFAAADRHQEAVKAYRHGLKIDSANAALHDGLAWLLASNPDPLVHDAPEAVKLAQEAVSLAPRVADYWRTLGVAHCEAADWKAGAKALEEAVKLRKGGDSIDWFFLAMAQAKLGDRDKASEYYSRGVRWMEENRPQDRALRRYRAKVERLLDLPEKE